MRLFRNITLIIILALFWTAFVGYGFIDGFLLRPIASENTSESFIEASKEALEDEFVAGRVIVLIEHGEVVETNFYSIDQNINSQTVFPVASISKWVTSWGVMKLVEQGKLDLDVPVDTYLNRWHMPKSDYDNDDVTIRRLLSHSSGVIRDIEHDHVKTKTNNQTIEELLMLYEGEDFIYFEPGSAYAYSNIGYAILQLVIEEVSQQSFPDYIEQTVFEPLQMRNSTFSLDSKPNLKLAQLYDGESKLTEPNTPTALAAAGLFTSVEDLARFMLANTGENPVLSQETLRLMMEPQTYINEIPVYGLGPDFYSQADPNSKVIGHDGVGGATAINTAARIDLVSKHGIIILQTGNYYTASAVADEWMFWKAGIADYVVMQRNIPYLVTILIISYILIITCSIVIIRRKNRQRGKVKLT